MSSEIYTKQKDLATRRIIKYLNTQVMDDEKLVKSILLVSLSAYTRNPLNLMIKAPTSEGKTYAATQVLKLFPKEDVLLLGGMSPTALVHEQGELVDENYESIDKQLEEINQKISESSSKTERQELGEKKQALLKNAKNLVNLSGKILLFLDTPNWELWRVLKPILSHDTEEIEFKVTDKKNNSLHTKSTIISGWPSVIYCSAKNEELFQDWSEIQNRFLIKSPNGEITKYKKAINFIAKKYSTPSFAKTLYKDEDYFAIAIHDIKEIKHKLQTHYHDNCFNPFEQLLADLLPNREGSAMRMAEKFFALCNLETFVNSENRCKLMSTKADTYGVKEDLITDIADIGNTISMMDNPAILSPEKMKFVSQVLKPTAAETLDGYITTKQLADKYDKVYGKPILPKQILENYLKSLEAVGIIDWKEDPSDRRTHLYRIVSDVKQNAFDDIKSKIIEYSMNNPSYVESRIKELVDYSSTRPTFEDANGQPLGQSQVTVYVEDPEGNTIPTDNLQSVLLSEPDFQTNIVPVFH